VAATLAAAIMMGCALVDVLRRQRHSGREDREGSNSFALIATIILAPIAAMLIQAANLRSREFDARDAGGSAECRGPETASSAR